MAYLFPFKYDLQEHKTFVWPKRHPVVGSKDVRYATKGKEAVSAHTLSREQEALLRLGLGTLSMDFKWGGNLSDSVANADKGERVVRLYRIWHGLLVYEARYRPLEGSTNGQLVLHEFAYEGDPATFHTLGDTLAEEVLEYQDVLQTCILDIIITRIRAPYGFTP